MFAVFDNHAADKPNNADRGPAVLFSVLCHLALLLLLALLTSAGQGDGPLTLLASFDDGLDAEESLEGVPSVQLESELETPAALELSELLEESPVEAPRIDVGLLPSGASPGEVSANDSGSLSSSVPGAPQAEFFGVGSGGRSFVYVIDCSTSMIEQGKFEHAKQELMRSLRALQPSQKYLIVLFSDGAYPMDDLEPIKANKRNLDKTAQWLYALEPEGGTNPLPALLYALSLEPSAVFFLSDGRFEPLVIETIRKENRPGRDQVPIHTISFYTRQTEGMMKFLARLSGGTYKFVAQLEQP